MKKAILILLFLGFMGSVGLGNNDVPVAISPGMAGGVGVVKDNCPTFSWSGVAWAQKYRVVVFGVEADGKKINDELALTAKPILSEDIAGGGLSWTPSVSQGLIEGTDYTWYVGAMDAGGTWAWSEPRRFRILKNSKLTLNEEEQTSLKQKKEKAEINDEKSLRAASGLSELKATSKDVAANTLEGPMGTEGTNSTFYGTNAGTNNSSDDNNNSFFGSSAGYSNTSGFDNTFIGYRAGYSNTTGDANTFIGIAAGTNNSTGVYNTLLGYYAGRSNTIGCNNTILGYNAGFYNTSGSGNIFVGWQAGGSNTTGYGNTIIGAEAGSNNISGINNVFLGHYAGYDETGSNKLYIDNSNISSPLIYGDFSTDKLGINGWLGVGTQAPAYPMELKTTGRNAAIVANRTDGAINFINATTSYGQFGTVNNFAVRILANAIWRMTLNTDNSLAMANGASCTAGGVWTNASSLALKENITTLTVDEAASTLQSLNPVKYNYKADKAENYVGFIAEDVPELVAMNDRKALSPMDIVAVLTKVVQEQQKMIEKQQEVEQEHRQDISFLKARLAALEKKAAEKK
jgi:hypothetical protein